MMHTYEAEVGEDGRVRLCEPIALQGRHRAVVTILEPLGEEGGVSKKNTTAQDWRQFTGIIKDSPHFNGDPVTTQKALRDEWR